eukprot:TRINITY_DN7400_c1_g1_i11.p1 TRINITY_DN7400_c1_g1~~TRINITY_DN7400_c1_g1_i11.p1  ORF type:complete len:546 (+),score=114.13 TRINITY_DN7400_c1_g1_i11:729-2366(+)
MLREDQLVNRRESFSDSSSGGGNADLASPTATSLIQQHHTTSGGELEFDLPSPVSGVSPDKKKQLHGQSKKGVSHVLKIIRKLWLLILLQILHNLSSAIRLAVFFPYLRTTVSCATPVDPHVATSSSRWSGSLSCGDKDYVARVGQERIGLAMGTNLIVQFLCISALGAAGDAFGRKPVIAVAWFGYLVESFINSFAGEFVFIVLGRVVQGVTGGYSTMMSAMIADVSGSHDRGSYYGVHMSIGSLTTLSGTIIANYLIVNQYLYDYKTVWVWLTIINAIGLALSVFVLKETIHSDKRELWSVNSVNPCGGFTAVSRYPFLLRFVFVLCLLIFSLMTVTLIPGFVIEVYSWKQDDAIALQILSSAVSTVAAGLSVVLIPRFGARPVILISFAILALAQVSFVLSMVSSLFMILANFLVGAAFAATPAYYEEISRFVPQNEQGKVQSAFSGAFLIAAGVGSVIFGKLFESLPGHLAFLPFTFSCATCFGIGLYLRSLFRDYPSGATKARMSVEQIVLADIDQEFSMIPGPSDPFGSPVDAGLKDSL